MKVRVAIPAPNFKAKDKLIIIKMRLNINTKRLLIVGIVRNKVAAILVNREEKTLRWYK